jgi:hypothetical protein
MIFTQPTSELVGNLNGNLKEQFFRALADTGTSSGTILETYATGDMIKSKNHLEHSG